MENTRQGLFQAAYSRWRILAVIRCGQVRNRFRRCGGGLDDQPQTCGITDRLDIDPCRLQLISQARIANRRPGDNHAVKLYGTLLPFYIDDHRIALDTRNGDRSI